MRRQTWKSRELREQGGKWRGDSMHFGQRNYEYTLGQMLHKQPEDLSIPLR